jgi:hypothetical protein
MGVRNLEQALLARTQQDAPFRCAAARSAETTFVRPATRPTVGIVEIGVSAGRSISSRCWLRGKKIVQL